MKPKAEPVEEEIGPIQTGSITQDELPSGSRSRRKFLVTTTSVVGLTGAVVGSWPFIASWLPSKRAQSLGAPIHINIDKIEPGTRVTAVWQGKPVWVVRRTPSMLEGLRQERLLEKLADPDSQVVSQQPEYAHNDVRSVREEFFVVIAICTHLGCVPLWRPDFPAENIDQTWLGGFFCPCHKSKFDLAGRVYKYVPAPTNLVIPPHRYLASGELEIGGLNESEKS